jgi:hypothetical protein
MSSLSSAVGNLTSYNVYTDPSSIFSLISGPPINSNITQSQAISDVENAETFLPSDSADALQFQVDLDQYMAPYYAENPNPYSSLLNEITSTSVTPTTEDVANTATGGNTTNPLTVGLSTLASSTTTSPNLLNMTNPFTNLILGTTPTTSTSTTSTSPSSTGDGASAAEEEMLEESMMDDEGMLGSSASGDGGSSTSALMEEEEMEEAEEAAASGGSGSSSGLSAILMQSMLNNNMMMTSSTTNPFVNNSASGGSPASSSSGDGGDGGG